MLFLCKMETTHKAKVRSVMILRLLTQWEAVICAWITAAIWRAHKHLWPPPWLETITGILSSYCIWVVKTRNDNFHACICSPSRLCQFWSLFAANAPLESKYTDKNTSYSSVNLSAATPHQTTRSQLLSIVPLPVYIVFHSALRNWMSKNDELRRYAF